MNRAGNGNRKAEDDGARTLLDGAMEGLQPFFGPAFLGDVPREADESHAIAARI